MELLNHLAARLCEERQYRLVVIDSIIALFRTDYSGRGELAERQQKLNQMMAKLMRIAEEFNVAVFITNQVWFGLFPLTLTNTIITGLPILLILNRCVPILELV